MIGEIRPSDIERFQRRVNPIPTECGCLLWTGGTGRGYGLMRWKHDRMTVATRVAWEIAYGTPPRGHLLHACDTPLCVNVAHLSEGDDHRNLVERYDRIPGVSIGELRSDSKLTFAAVDEARTLYATERYSIDQLAERYSITYTTMRAALTGEAWRRGCSVAPVTLLPRTHRSEEKASS
jgi:hypothetical protein